MLYVRGEDEGCVSRVRGRDMKPRGEKGRGRRELRRRTGRGRGISDREIWWGQEVLYFSETKR